jgi:PPP family 3-phenylpropionic acid transporter
MKQDKTSTILLKSTFFFAFIGLSSWLTFFNLYLKEIGFNGSQTGIMGSLFPATMLFVVPLWGYLADRFGKINIITIVMTAALLFIPAYLIHYSFIYILFVTIMLSIFYTPFGSIIDSISLDHIQFYKRSSYGKLRLWGSVGWATAALSTSYIIDKVGSYSVIFPIASGCFLIAMIIIRFFYKPPKAQKSQGSLKLRESLSLLKKKEIIIFVVILFLYGIASSPIFQFLNLYYDEIGASSKLIGYAFAIQSITELPFFIYADKIVKRFGARRVLFFAMAITGLRFLLYYWINNPAYALLVGLAHGISISLMLVSAVSYLHKYVPAHLRASGQSLIWAFYIGAGGAAGNLLSGLLKDYIGMNNTMGIYGIAILVLVVAGFAFFKSHKLKKIGSFKNHVQKWRARNIQHFR